MLQPAPVGVFAVLRADPERLADPNHAVRALVELPVVASKRFTRDGVTGCDRADRVAGFDLMDDRAAALATRARPPRPSSLRLADPQLLTDAYPIGVLLERRICRDERLLRHAVTTRDGGHRVALDDHVGARAGLAPPRREHGGDQQQEKQCEALHGGVFCATEAAAGPTSTLNAIHMQ